MRIRVVSVLRYAPATQLWRGRLHVMGGSKEDRHEPATEHWSLGVKDGRALESEWRPEMPIPRGGPHRSIALPPHYLQITPRLFSDSIRLLQEASRSCSISHAYHLIV